MHLPNFKYHPDPIATGSIEQSSETCECCGQARGYMCVATIYARESIEFICPWCVADGSAAKKYDGMFNDDYPLVEAGLAEAIVEEVTQRTPGYSSWQQEEWQAHCNDACEFHGDAEKDELQALQGDALRRFLSDSPFDEADWKIFLKHYEPGGNPAVYKFLCRHCGELIYTMDYT